MPKKRNDRKKPTSLVQVASIVALVALVWIDSQAAPEFEINFFVYAIFGGLLIGVTNIRDIFK